MKPIETNPTGKQYKTALVLSFFFGGLGVDRFYLGKIGTGILKLLTLGGLGVWYIIDVYLIAHGKLKSKDGLALNGAGDPDGTIRLFATLFLILQLIGYVFYLLGLIVLSLMAANGTLPQTNQSSPYVTPTTPDYSTYEQ